MSNELSIVDALKLGIEAHKAGKAQEADRYYTAILKVQPKHADANHNMGVLAVGIGKVEMALPFFKTALEVNPNIEQFWISYIDALIKLKRVEDADAIISQAQKKGIKSDDLDRLKQNLKNLGLVDNNTFKNHGKAASGQFNILDTLKLDQALRLAKHKSLEGLNKEAVQIYRDIVCKFPKNKKALAALKQLSRKPGITEPIVKDGEAQYIHNLQNLYNSGEIEVAYRQATNLVRKQPNSAELYNLLGLITHGLGRIDEAINAWNKALSIRSDYAEVFFNVGNAFNDQGNIEKAKENFKMALSASPDYAECHNNMGILLLGEGKINEALSYWVKAVSIKPDYADAYINQGIALTELGRSAEALEAYKKALNANPNSEVAYFNMANNLLNQGIFNKAILAYQKALSILPHFAEAYNNLGIAYEKDNQIEPAIRSYIKAIDAKPKYIDALSNFGIILKNTTFIKQNLEARDTIITLLEHNGLARPIDLSQAVISLLKFEPVIKSYFARSLGGNSNKLLAETIEDLSKLKLLLKFISICPVADSQLEKLLKELRTYFLLSVSTLSQSSSLLELQSALALQCFTNEYIYEVSVEEKKALKSLENKVKQQISDGAQPNPKYLLCLGSYRPLYQYDWIDKILNSKDLSAVYKRQIREPEQEICLKESIPQLRKVGSKLSSKVRAQYEANPYPRWVDLALPIKSKTISQIITDRNLRVYSNGIRSSKSPNILIAGCGTGQHSIEAAKRFKNSNLLAIDLSLSSLCYAKRKTEELGIKNIDYLQADILDLDKLGRKFEIIESVGVLHHMSNPLEGWRKLKDILKQGGLMKIGLYSELARQHIVKLREEINLSGISSSNSAMKKFRTKIVGSKKEHYKLIQESPDFYALSNLRDLLFHVQEHRFTIAKIKDCLKDLNLKFSGFDNKMLINKFVNYHGNGADIYNLDSWSEFESKHPRSFAGMYQFYCQKVD